jgi:hypothetical protein
MGLEDEMGPIEREIDELFTRGLAADPLILRLLTGELAEDDAISPLPISPLLMFQLLGRVMGTHREALTRLARKMDDLGSS